MSVIPVTLRDSFFTDRFFQSSWEDFEKIKSDMLKESREFWERAHKSNEQMMKSMNNMENKSNSMQQSSSSTTSSSSTAERKSSREENSNNVRDMMTKDMMSLGNDDFFAPWFFPRRWMLPTSMFSDDKNNAMSKEVSTLNSNENSSSKRMLFPSDFFSSLNSDEQVIRTKEDDTKFEVSLDTHDYRPEEIKVNIVGNVVSVEGKHEEKGENKFVSRQFSRKYTLPEGCEANRVSSNLSSDGILMITAPKKEVKKVEAGQRAVPITMKN